MNVEQLVGETGVLGEDPPQCQYVHHSTRYDLGSKPSHRGGTPLFYYFTTLSFCVSTLHSVDWLDD